MSSEKYDIGYTGCYISDHSFDHIVDIPVEAAVEWVKKAVPFANMGNITQAIGLTLDGNYTTDATQNGWLNKLFIIVGHEHYKFIALYNHDGVFSIRRES